MEVLSALYERRVYMGMDYRESFSSDNIREKAVMNCSTTQWGLVGL